MANEEPHLRIGGRAGLDDHMQQLFLDAGRVSVLGGWLVINYSFGDPAVNATHVFLGFALLLLGVVLLTFSPAASQFPWVAQVGAVVANAVLNHLFAHRRAVRPAMANEEPHQRIGGLAGLDDHIQQLFRDAGRVCVLGGWFVVTYSFGDPAANATHVFLGFALLLLGVVLLTFSPAAYRFPWVTRAGAAVATAVLNHLFAPGN